MKPTERVIDLCHDTRELIENAKGLIQRRVEVGRNRRFERVSLTVEQKEVVNAEASRALEYVLEELDKNDDRVKFSDKVWRVIQFGSTAYTFNGRCFRTRSEDPEDASDVDILVVLDMNNSDFVEEVRRRGVERGYSWDETQGMQRAFIEIPSITGEVKKIELKFITQETAGDLLKRKVSGEAESQQTLLAAIEEGIVIYES